MRLLFKAAILSGLVYFVFIRTCGTTSQVAIKRLQQNYASEIEQVCKELDVPDEYFKALIILECSAMKNPPSRFEPHVFRKLQQLRNGKIKRYATLQRADVQNCSDATLKLLASSWGALQIMGYHCFYLGISIDQLKGKQNLYQAVRWCKLTYGKYLAERRYRDAFHFHNTGKPHPDWWFLTLTHDPTYVNKGIAYTQYFGVLH